MSDQDNVETNPVLATGLAAVALLGVLGGLLPPGLLGHLVEQAAEPAAGPTASGVEEQAAPQVPTTTGAAAIAVPATQGEAPAGMPQSVATADKPPQTAEGSGAAATAVRPVPPAASPPSSTGARTEAAGPAPVYRPPSTWYTPPQAPGYPAQPYLVPPYPAPYEPYDPYYGRPYRTR